MATHVENGESAPTSLVSGAAWTPGPEGQIE